MKISDLQFTAEMRENIWRGHSIQTTTDAHRLLGNERTAEQYIEQFGDQEIEYDEKCKYWRVPKFAESRKRYIEQKQVDCERWGCE
ncbi:MAG: hypothetical protein ACTSWQ_00215 [Candidatus Thorarchaeota archaeon]